MKVKFIILKLTIIPLLVEVGCITVFSHFLLELPWIFSAMLGFIVSSVSPEVVAPILIRLKEMGYGVYKGIPSLIIVASTLDDIIAISGFTICFSVALSAENLTWAIIRGPIEPVLGCAFGCIIGILFWYFPQTHTKMNYVHIATSVLWRLIQPFFFITLGAEITLDAFNKNAGYGFLCLLLSLLCRIATTFGVCSFSGMNWKEKVFVCCGWMPKVTVQIAIGSQILDYARVNKLDAKLLDYGTIVANVSVLSIFLSVPLGAALTHILGPILLNRDFIPLDSDEDTFESEEDFTCIELSELSAIKADELILTLEKLKDDSAGNKAKTI